MESEEVRRHIKPTDDDDDDDVDDDNDNEHHDCTWCYHLLVPLLCWLGSLDDCHCCVLETMTIW